MNLPVFKLEEFLGQYEFKAKYLFCNSDMETFSIAELLSMADQDGLDSWSNLKLGYTEDRGSPPLLDAIRKIYRNLTDRNILTFAGAEEGIYCLFHALLSSEDHVIVVTPCYQSLETIPKSIGCKVTRVNLDEQYNWELDIDQVKCAIQKNTKLIVINFPHNPTGTTLDIQTLNELIELARKNGITLFSDEVYRLLELDIRNRMAPLVDLYENGISLGVMSKAYGLPGLRIGWLACQDSTLLDRARQIKHYLSICNSAPSEILAVIALRASEKILKRNHDILKFNLELLDSFFKRNSDLISWTRPNGGCVGFPKILRDISIDDFASRLVKEKGVLVMPGSIYDVKTNHFRIGFGRKNMPEALDRFQDALKDL